MSDERHSSLITVPQLETNKQIMPMALLLKEFENRDIDWLLTCGSLIEVPPDTCVVQPGQPTDDVYFVLEGGLSVTLQTPDEQKQLEIARLPSGEFFGGLPAVPQFLPPALIKTLLPTRLLKVSGQQLVEQMECDRTFAAHLYQTAAQLLTNRIGSIAQRCGYSLGLLSQLQLKEATTVFGALQDSDLDWLIAVGQQRSLEPDEILLQRGRPLDQLHLVLEGAIRLSAPEQAQPHMVTAFGIASCEETEFSRLSRGNLVGEMMFVDSHPPLFTARAVRETQVLSIPRWRLMTRLLYEPEFAVRLYQVLSTLFANKQQSILQQLGFGHAATELSHERLSQLSLAEARFDWMVKRLQANSRTPLIQQP